MPGRRLARRSLGSAHRRVTTWATVTQTVSLAAANDYFTFDLLANFKADGGTQQGVTVMRTHLRQTVASTHGATANFAVGLIRGQNTDVGNNVAGAPVPDTDPYEDWAFWAWYFADSNGFFAEGGSDHLPLDIKAMRKFPELQMSYNYVAKVLASSAFPFVVQVTGRVLLALP